MLYLDVKCKSNNTALIIESQSKFLAAPKKNHKHNIILIFKHYELGYNDDYLANKEA